MHLCPHISVASGANAPKALGCGTFLTYCGGLTAPSADEVVSLLRADAPFNVRVVSVFIIISTQLSKTNVFF